MGLQDWGFFRAKTRPQAETRPIKLRPSRAQWKWRETPLFQPVSDAWSLRPPPEAAEADTNSRIAHREAANTN
jgi:hypothetical protein